MRKENGQFTEEAGDIAWQGHRKNVLEEFGIDVEDEE